MKNNNKNTTKSTQGINTSSVNPIKNTIFLNTSENNIQKGVSVFTICKNRNANFEKALATWVKYDSIDEIVVVDWSSDVPLKKIIDKYQNGKIILAEVENTMNFSRSIALNLSARLTSFDKIIRLDADIQLQDDFIKKHPLEEKFFYTGHWKNARNKNELALFGIIYMHRKHFFKVNGVSEYIEQYGWEDSDLYHRLEATGLKRLDIDNDTVYHIPHESRSSFKNEVMEDLNASDELKAFFTTMVNKKISEEILPWTIDDKMINYEIKTLDKNTVRCFPQGPKTTVITEENYTKGKRLTLIDFLSWDTGINPKTSNNPYSDFSIEDLLKIYIVLREEFQSKEWIGGFHLLFMYDVSWSLAKKMNAIYSIYKNMQNPFISSVHAFVKNGDNKIDGLFKAFSSKYPIVVTESAESPTLDLMINYSNEYLSNQKIIILNEAIYFDLSLEKLQSFDFQNKLLLISAQHKDKNTSELPFIHGCLPNYYTSDCFIFSAPFKTNAYLKFKIDDPYYVPFVIGQISHSDTCILNPCLEINAFKNAKYDKTSTINFQQWTDHLDKIDQPKFGVIWSDLKSESNKKNLFFHWHQKNLILKIQKEDWQLLKNIIKIAELYDRNIWIVNEKISSEFTDQIRNITNANVNLIKKIDKTHHGITVFKEGSIEDFIANDKNQTIYLESSMFPSSLIKYKYINKIDNFSQPKISVITPSFNSSKCIDFAIQSVLFQDYPNYEHIIIDGGSTDNTIEILKKYPHLTWITEKDNGQSDAMNKGFNMSTGDVIVYLNADDAFLPGIFKEVINYFKQGSEVVMGNVKVTQEDGSFWMNLPKYKHIDVIKHWEHQAFCVNPVGYFYLKQVQEVIGGFNNNNHLTMDLEFLLSLSKQFLITRVNQTFGIFRNFSGTKTVESSTKQEIWNINFFPYLTNYIHELPQTISIKLEKQRIDGYKKRAAEKETITNIEEGVGSINHASDPLSALRSSENSYDLKLYKLEYELKAQKVNLQIKDSKIGELQSYITLLKDEQLGTLKKEREWYKATYEDRSILGILKDRFFNMLKS